MDDIKNGQRINCNDVQPKPKTIRGARFTAGEAVGLALEQAQRPVAVIGAVVVLIGAKEKAASGRPLKVWSEEDPSPENNSVKHVGRFRFFDLDQVSQRPTSCPFEPLNLHTNRESCISKGDRKPPSPQTLAPALILLGLFLLFANEPGLNLFVVHTEGEHDKARCFPPPWSL
jgi:hypothetical protein